MDEHKSNDPAPDGSNEKKDAPTGNFITRLYDKLPVTFKQVDIFVKVMFVLLAALLIYGIVKGNR